MSRDIEAVRAVFAFKTPFQAALDFFRSKLNLPTERWDDIMLAAHDRAFIVAGVAKADLLMDLRQAMDNAIAKGTGLEAFRREFRATVARRGWTGWTGEGSKAGEAWRTRVIYQTNLATSYAAGRHRQLTDPATLQAMPWWKYVHQDGLMHPRPLHQSWGGLELRHDHPFWRTHWAPNGWGCHCRITALRRPSSDATTTPPDGWDAIDPSTGSPPGIDRGFGYQPGASVSASMSSLVQAKLITYPPAIAKALAADLDKLKDSAP